MAREPFFLLTRFPIPRLIEAERDRESNEMRWRRKRRDKVLSFHLDP
jgi:hypothetical protein